MRRRLIAVFVAISSMVAIAFVVPLGFLVRSAAEDRAIDAARNDTAAVVPSLVSGGSRAQIESAAGATQAGREGRMTVVTAEGWVIGLDVDSPALDRALGRGSSSIVHAPGGVEVVTAVAAGPDALSAVRVFVATDELRRGQWQAWGTLAAVGLVLVGISVVVADRLAQAIVRPTESLAVAARHLGQGDLTVRVTPSGPPELQELGGAFNELGGRVGLMLDRERELVAELSHRLRTPLTKLRMRIDQVDDDTLAAELVADTEDLTTTVNDLIAEARGALDESTGSGTQPLCEAGTIVTERAEFWQVLAQDQGRPFRFEAIGGDLTVPVEAGELAAAIDVLIDNVFAHTEDGTALTIGYERRDGEARIRVEDGGDGIATDQAAPGVSQSGSTGIGLSIARRTAEQAGGSLELSTSTLGGTAVALVLPIVDGQGQ